MHDSQTAADGSVDSISQQLVSYMWRTASAHCSIPVQRTTNQSTHIHHGRVAQCQRSLELVEGDEAAQRWLGHEGESLIVPICCAGDAAVVLVVV